MASWCRARRPFEPCFSPGSTAKLALDAQVPIARGEQAVQNLVRRLVREDQGQDLIEYAFLVAFIALAVILSLQSLGAGVSTQMTNIGTQVTGS